MSSVQLVILALLFLCVVAISLFIFTTATNTVARRRLQETLPSGGVRSQYAAGPTWWRRVEKVSRPLAKMSLPDAAVEEGSFRVRFYNAGLRDASAPTTFFGAKTALAILLPLIVYVLFLAHHAGTMGFSVRLIVLLVAAALGYYAPNLILAQMIKSRQQEVFHAFPDALDLMTICMEAGLGTEAAIGRVADDIAVKSPVLSEELHLMSLELRAGSDRPRALRNIAMRTGVEEVEMWAAMLIQSDRFGTSIADSLRVYSDMLRTKRQQRAEETAAKVALKLLFPLMFFIFPALMVVLMGPAMIKIYRAMVAP